MRNEVDKDESQVVRCPVCGDPLGFNKDGEVLPCQSCAGGNIPE